MIPSVAADAGLAGAKYLGAQGQAFVDDPIGYFISITRKLGAVFAVAGTGMGIAAYFLKAAEGDKAEDVIAAFFACFAGTGVFFSRARFDR